jgi:RNA polymerase primary sigma factor
MALSTTSIVAEDLLSEAEERRLGRTIELGIFARQALEEGRRPAGSTSRELRRIAAEGKQAWARFLLANVRLVASMVYADAARHVLDAEDLFQEGFVALADALRRYDYRRARFSTFAYQRIRQHVNRLICSRMGELPMSPTMAVERARLIRLMQQADQAQGESRVVEQAAEWAGKDRERLRALVSSGPTVSLDEDDRVLELPTKVNFEAAFERESVYRGMRSLSAVEREVISLRYGFACSEPLPIAHVAKRMALSTSGVRRMEMRALDKLRHTLDTDMLAS